MRDDHQLLLAFKIRVSTSVVVGKLYECNNNNSIKKKASVNDFDKRLRFVIAIC